LLQEKLHRLLGEVEVAGRADVISFVGQDAFRIHKPELFFAEIVPRYFRHSRLSSFKRQLNLYGFSLVGEKGDAQGGYRHELFRKDEPALCRRIRRVAIKQLAQRKPTTASLPPPPPPPPTMSDEESMVEDDDDDDDDEEDHLLQPDDLVDDAFKEDLDDGTDLNDASIGSTERTDNFALTITDHDHESVALHDPSTLDGLYFES
jgi:HSF-type DNA-binding